MDYGIKISQPGIDVFDANPEDLVFSSKYKTLKVSSRGNGTLTDSARTATIPHGLGYVPFFLVHTQLDPSVATNAVVGDNTDYFINPFRLSGAIGTYEAENTHDIVAWADSTNLYIIARSNVGKDIYPIAIAPFSNLDEQLAYEDDFGYTTGDWVVGNHSATGQNIEDGAVRTNGGVILDQGQTVYSATLNLYVGGRVGSGEVKMRVYGVDEDNTGAFNSGTPATARAKTSASTDHNTTLSAGQSSGVNVKGQIEEIAARAGWVSGNRMGFIMNDNGTVADNDYFEPSGGSVLSTLEIMRSSTLANFKYTVFLNQLE